MEITILNWIQTLRSGWLDSVMVGVSLLGDHGMIWLALIGTLMTFKKTRKIGIVVALSLVMEVVCTSVILKPFVARPRPFEINTAITLLVNRPMDYSFPSGHTGAAFACMGALYFSETKGWIPVGIFAVLTAISRMYLYVHYPSDVFAGTLLGIMFGWVAYMVTKRLFFRIPLVQKLLA